MMRSSSPKNDEDKLNTDDEEQLTTDDEDKLNTDDEEQLTTDDENKLNTDDEEYISPLLMGSGSPP